MSKDDWFLAIDQGTSGTTALAVRKDGTVEAKHAREVKVSTPSPGWVEQDARELVDTSIAAARDVCASMGCLPRAAGLTNQRETVVVFDRTSLLPLHPAIVWQCRRTAPLCDELRREGMEDTICRVTGLVIDPYFSATKMAWIMEQSPDIAAKLRSGDAAIGTVDAWLVAALTKGRSFITDVSNASRTMLVDLRTAQYDDGLVRHFGLDRSMLPEIVDSAGNLAILDASILGEEVPLCGIAGDQQASLFGQRCLAPGQAKCTYGTGSFVLAQLGQTCGDPIDGILTTIAWRIAGTISYALEGGTFTAGAALTWLRDSLGIIDGYAEIEYLIAGSSSGHDAVFLPALAGLGSPWWEQDVRGAFAHLSLATDRGAMLEAVLEGIAFSVRDIVDRMEKGSGFRLEELHVDGGLTASPTLLRRQADALGVPLQTSSSAEVTGIGAALLAAVGSGSLPLDTLAAKATGGTSLEPSRTDRNEERYGIWAGYRDAFIQLEGNRSERNLP